MEATINLNSVSSPVGINLIVGIVFLLFYLINKETRSDFHKLFLGVLVTISLSYAMTRGAYLLQTLSIVLYLQFILMVFYQEIDLLPYWKIPIIFIYITV